jgi:hypothetical protein
MGITGTPYQMAPDLDFSSLARLPQVYQQGQDRAATQQAMEQFRATGDPRVLLNSGNLKLADLGVNMLNRQQDQQRQAQLDQRQSQLDQRQLERDKIGDSRWAQEFELKRKEAAQGGGVYGTPIYGRDPETGKVVLGAIAKNGQFRRIDTSGVEMTPGGIKPLDTGTGYVPFDPRSGAVVGGQIPKTGEISKDYAPVAGPGGTISAAPIPGTPAAQKIEEDQTKATARAETTAVGAGAIKGIVSDIRDKVAKAPWYSPVVGFGAETAAKVTGSPAHDTGELIKTVTSNIGFDRLQRMREESPTGGALGAVAVQELESLQKTIASLAQSQSKGQFLGNLKRVEEQYERIAKKAAAYPNASKHGFKIEPGGITQEQYNQLKSGDVFIAPDGSQRVKP